MRAPAIEGLTCVTPSHYHRRVPGQRLIVPMPYRTGGRATAGSHCGSATPRTTMCPPQDDLDRVSLE